MKLSVSTWRRPFVGLLAAVSLIVAASPASPHAVSSSYSGWADRNCHNGNGNDISIWRKSVAKSYALVAVHEGYHWGGGCWNDGDSDNQRRSSDVQNEPPHGEGADCSGFTFKTWALKADGGFGKHEWPKFAYRHGPYVAQSFRDAPTSGSVVISISKRNAGEMDAMASGTHVGMIWATRVSRGGDIIIEAKCEMCGTIKGFQSYRSSSSYQAAARQGWSSEPCYRCI